ncbi:NADH-quinone oxidoreductase subunit M [Tessaracoccus sp. ZS01]|uniref:NADH-quinone oxidoreductase subunit M n=1 Tax=Tessaracoccus sp. ZS01 TaxID=1906324 RepID=UPI00096FA518|nr:NADH-quinone oxidoreductase subunit M [Tessaracoccus sp. ZS01]MCG6567280.1 NADH-quinone oxidoreductase subunit M [Tessaracoccus sp. ZS01]OMG57240.1 NADH-quinone oxidoreductase subunit M [Tessaracoccus sp. ZS01]
MAFPLLTVLGLVPIVGAIVLFFVKGHVGKLVGYGFAVTTLVLGVLAFILHTQDAVLAEDVSWISAIGARYALDLDGMGAILVLMTVLIVPVVLLAEWHTGDEPTSRWGGSTFFALALLLQGFALFVFMASDILLFYVAFEATLIPTYFLIGGYGGPRRSAAAVKFLIYSLAGGLVMLVAVAGVYAVTAAAGSPSFLIGDLVGLDIDTSMGRWLFAGFFFAFAVKAPLAGLHTWLPDSAEQATPGTSTLLVGILDKIGTFGMIKICLQAFPEASQWATPVILIWAIVSMFYGALMAFGAKDLLRLVSYTSISHFGLMVFGIFALTSQSMSGSIYYMLNHGLSTAALFLVVGFMIRRRGSADIDAYGGVQKVAPVLSGVLLLAGLSALSLPGFGNFVAEFLVLAGSWQRYPIHIAFLVLAMVLAAVYVLRMYKTTMTGPVTEQVASHVTTDLTLREKAVVAPLIALLLLFGFFPKPVLAVADDAAQGTMATVGVTDPAPQAEEGN